MFGYVKVDRANLLGKEYDAYKGVYCSLCKQLGKDYSIFARFILSYDCTFYAMLALDLAEKPPCYTQGRCRFNPFKKCLYAETDTKAFQLAAALSVISAYYKLKDNLLDSPWYKRLGYWFVQPFFSSWRRKAKKNYPAIEDSVRDMLEHQIKSENDPECVLDMAADPTAVMLSQMSAMLTDEIELRKPLLKDTTKRILSSTGYYLGRWIYLIDAADDYEKDKKHKNFNPFLLKAYSDDEFPKYIEQTLNHALSETLLSYGLLNKGRYDSIILNVLQSSCVMIQNSILDKFKVNKTQDSEINR